MFLSGIPVPPWGVAGVRAPFYFGVRGVEHRMRNLKTDGMSKLERLILFIVLAALLLFVELARQENVKHKQAADFEPTEQAEGGE